MAFQARQGLLLHPETHINTEKIHRVGWIQHPRPRVVWRPQRGSFGRDQRGSYERPFDGFWSVLISPKASPRAWEHTQMVREEEGWLDSTFYGQYSLKDGCAWEGSFMGVGNDPLMVFDHVWSCPRIPL